MPSEPSSERLSAAMSGPLPKYCSKYCRYVTLITVSPAQATPTLPIGSRLRHAVRVASEGP